MAKSFDSVLSEPSRQSMREIGRMFASKSVPPVPLKSKALNLLRSENAAKWKLFKTSQVVPHPQNRDRQFITASGVATRAVELKAVGFDLDILEKETVVFQDNPASKEIAQHAMRHLKTDQRFAQYAFHEIEAGSVGGSHTTHVVESVKQERPCTLQGISVDGKYDKHMFYENQSFKQAAEDGVHYWAIRWEIEAEFPWLPCLFQSALNAPQHVGQGDCR